MIGLMSFHESLSYGAVLQCYALQTAIQNRGFDCEFIDYKRQPVTTAQLGGSLAYKLKRFSLNGISALKKVILKAENEKKKNSFSIFREQYINISDKSYFSFEELNSAELPYNAVIVGSDQVWNPVTTGNNLKVYGLGFLSKGIRRIAYAPSIGLGTLNEIQKNVLSKNVGELDFYSCREYTGSELLESVLGRPVEHVLDPTFLLNRNEWKKVEKEINTPSKYVLAYLLGSMSYERELASKIAKELRAVLLVVRESPRDMFSMHGVGGLGPAELLYLIDHAEYVITDSFHGTALSINLRKDFLCCNRRGYEKATSYASRLSNLLHTLNLEAAQVNENNWREKLNYHVDYSNVDEKLDVMIKKSNLYLDSALNF